MYRVQRRSPTASGSRATPGSTSTSRSSAGEAGLLVVDTQASADWPASGRRPAPGRAASRCCGRSTATSTGTTPSATACSEGEGAELICHESRRRDPAGSTRREVRAAAAEEDDPRYAAVAATEVVVPERTFSSAIALDLGDRLVELVHPGRGHTAGDLVVRVPDADVVLAGDLVEESEGNAVPGSATTATRWTGRSPSTSCSACPRRRPWSSRATARVVDREFVEEQRNDDRHRRRDDPRPRHPRRAASTTPWPPAEWPYPPRAARPRRPPRVRAPAPQPEAAPARLTGTPTGVLAGTVARRPGHDRDPRQRVHRRVRARRGAARGSPAGRRQPAGRAAADDPDAERQDLGDPHIDGLGRDEDDQPVAPDTDASEDAHHGAPDSDD